MNTALSARLVPALVVLIGMIAAPILAEVIRPSAKVADEGPKIDLETIIPRQFGSWHVDESTIPVQPAPDVKAQLDLIYSQTLARTYINDQGVRMMLSIAYGSDQSDNLQLHLPEGCYKGQGFAVGEKERGLIETRFGTIPVAKLQATYGPRIEPITYWIVVGGIATTSTWDAKWSKLSHTFSGRVPDGILIRVSSIDRDSGAAFEMQKKFAVDLLESLTADQRLLLIGNMEGVS